MTAIGRKSQPNVVARTSLVLVAAALVSAAGLIAVDLVTSPAEPLRAQATMAKGPGEPPAARESGEEERSRNPRFGEGMGELALQFLLVGGIALVGRKFLKVHL